LSDFLLDTNILSNLVRDPQGRVADKIADVGEDTVATSIAVAAELRFGAAKKGSPRLSARIDAILGSLTIMPLEPPVDAIYARVRADLDSRGTPIGGNDLLLAAHALALGRVLVTANGREFERVAGLEIQNWLES